LTEKCYFLKETIIVVLVDILDKNMSVVCFD